MEDENRIMNRIDKALSPQSRSVRNARDTPPPRASDYLTDVELDNALAESAKQNIDVSDYLNNIVRSRVAAHIKVRDANGVCLLNHPRPSEEMLAKKQLYG